MRLWSIHPAYLDARGLVAVWREGLLALAVVGGKTKGYRHHPQLERFRRAGDAAAAVRCYLWHVYQEAHRRGYRFDRRKIGRLGECPALEVTRGQLRFELAHLKEKLRVRDGRRFETIRNLKTPRPHPLFAAVAGGVESWERIR